MLKITNLSKHFGSLQAVSDLSLSAAKGESVVIMGPSGCGKSTTIRMINRLVQPDAGKILVDGTDVTSLNAVQLCQFRKKIGYVFQHFNLISRLSACENVMLGLVMAGVDREVAAAKARAALLRVGMDKWLDSSPAMLSGGQQQRVAIARCIALEPELMLWDEPTASLDPILVREILLIMEELIRDRRSTMLIVTHELAFALKAADKIVLMEKGRIAESGTAGEIFLQPRTAIGRLYQELLSYQSEARISLKSGN